MFTHRAGESRSEARGNISFEGLVGPENTSYERPGGGGGGGGGGRGPTWDWPNTTVYTSVVVVVYMMYV